MIQESGLAVSQPRTIAPTCNIPMGDEWGAMVHQATVLVKSGFLPAEIKTPEQALAIMIKGRELGIPPMVALSHIYIIKGKPSCGVQLQLGLCYERIPGFKCEVYSTKQQAVCIVKRPGHKAFKTSFSIDDAKAAGLTSNDTYRKYPQIMLEYRAIGHALKIAAPEVTMGLETPGMFEPNVIEEDDDIVVAVGHPDKIQDSQNRNIHREKRRVFGEGDEADERYKGFLCAVIDKESVEGATFEEAGKVIRMFAQMPTHCDTLTETVTGDLSAMEDTKPDAVTQQLLDGKVDEASEIEYYIGLCKQHIEKLVWDADKIGSAVEMITGKKQPINKKLSLVALQALESNLQAEVAFKQQNELKVIAKLSDDPYAVNSTSYEPGTTE